MSARITPDDLRKIAPDEYARIYGARGSPPKPADEVDEIEAEARLIRAQARLLKARRDYEEARRDRSPPVQEKSGSLAFWVAIVIAIVQFIFAWYVITHY